MKLSFEDFHKKYDFQWELLEVVIGGKSMIDTSYGLGGFPMRTHEDADKFMRCYGYDLDDSIEKAEVFGNFHEALNFIRKHFLKPENPNGFSLDIPRKILEISDVRELLLIASGQHPSLSGDRQSTALRDWACTVLKIIHAIAHIDKDVRYSYFTDIQKQIFDRFYRCVHRDGAGNLYLGEKEGDLFRVNLKAFETKPKKSRESVLLKLLHKPENVADDVFDRVAMRFITHTKLDALRVVKYLKDLMILMPANVKPSRSRNTLIPVKQYQEVLPSLIENIREGRMQEREFEDALNLLQFQAEDLGPDRNPHSSIDYRSIQFTGRQLIKLKNPLYEDLKEIRALTKTKSVDPIVVKAIETIDTKYLQREIRFFYPFEVQVVDQVSHEQNERGKSAHSEYKQAQVQTAMKRTMGRLIENANGV